LLVGMLPALAEQDVEAFGEALYEYNARSGELFAAVQGGTYADRRVADLVAFLRREGVRGVGQSSWGPAVFAVTAHEDRAAQLTAGLHTAFGPQLQQVLWTAGANQGADMHRAEG